MQESRVGVPSYSSYTSGSFTSTPSHNSGSITSKSSPTSAGTPNVKRRSLWAATKEGISSLSPGKKQHVNSLFKDLNSDSLKLFSSISASVLHHVDSVDNKATQVFLMHYLQKSAAIEHETAKNNNRPISPLGQTTQHYHRDYQSENVLLNALSQAVASESRNVIDVKDIICVADETSHMKTLKIFRDVVSVSKEEEIQKHISDAIKIIDGGGKLPQSFIMIDNLIDNKLSFSERAACIRGITDRISTTIPPQYEKQISEKIGIITTQTINGQPILIAPALSSRFGESNLNIKSILKEHIITAGHTPTMLQATTSLVNLKNFEELAGSKISMDKIKLKENNFKTADDFYNNSSVKDYAKLTGEKHPPAVQLLAKANTNLAKGLNTEKLAILLKDPKLQPIVNGSLNRIAALMKESIKHADNHTAFSLCHELMAEEFLLILNLSTPFLPDAFPKIYNKNRSEALDNNYQSNGKIRPKHMEAAPVVLAMRSGMSCVDAIVRAMHQTKPNLTIAGLNNSYFQTHQSLSELNAKKGIGMPTYHGIDPQESNGIATALQQLNPPPDVVYLDLRPAADMKAQNYAPKDLNNVEGLLNARTPQDGPLTLALDVTLDKLHSKEIDDFVARHQQAITERKLNLVLYRSAQKFDQLGVDKFNAGYLELHTTDINLQSTFKNIDGQLTGLDYQALCLYHQNAHDQIHNYLKLHYENNNAVYSQLKNHFDQSASLLRLTPKQDDKLFFMEFKYPAFKDKKSSAAFQDAFIGYLTNEAKQQGIPLFLRDSFGYNESTVCGIGEEKVRLSLGTHPPEELKKISKIIEECDKKLLVFANSASPNKPVYDLNKLTDDQQTALIKLLRSQS